MNKRSNSALIIFCKSPDPSTVKTRLSPVLSDEERLRLYTFLLNRIITTAREIEGIDVYLCYSPPDAGSSFERFGLRLFPQTDGDLGIRMAKALSKIFSEGYARAIIVGSDIPELDGDIIKRAFSILDNRDIVFGPAHDGGYYLVGMSRLHKELFEGIPWSSEKTLESSLRKAEALGLTYGLTGKLHDLDRPEDIVRFRDLVDKVLPKNSHF